MRRGLAPVAADAAAGTGAGAGAGAGAGMGAGTGAGVTLGVPATPWVPVKENRPSIAEADSHGCCWPPVLVSASSLTLLDSQNRSSPGWRIASTSDSVNGLSRPAPPRATAPGWAA
jgi:hypothetical protein